MEKAAARDLQDTVQKMTGASIPVVSDPGEVQAILETNKPTLIVGELALSQNQSFARS